MYPAHRMNSGPRYSRLIARNNAETNAALAGTTVAKNLRNFWRWAPYNRPLSLSSRFSGAQMSAPRVHACPGPDVFSSLRNRERAYLSFYGNQLQICERRSRPLCCVSARSFPACRVGISTTAVPRMMRLRLSNSAKPSREKGTLETRAQTRLDGYTRGLTSSARRTEEDCRAGNSPVAGAHVHRNKLGTNRQTHRNSARLSPGDDGALSPDAPPPPPPPSVYTKILLTWASRTGALTPARALDDAINREERPDRPRLSSFYKRERKRERAGARYRHPANSVYALNHEPTIPDVISNTRC